MKVPGLVMALSLLAGAGCKPGESAALRACQAELARKEHQISLLRSEIQAAANTAKEQRLSADTASIALEGRIRDLQRQLEYATTQILRGEVQARDVIENQRKSFQDKVNGLQDRVVELERKLAERK